MVFLAGKLLGKTSFGVSITVFALGELGETAFAAGEEESSTTATSTTDVLLRATAFEVGELIFCAGLNPYR